MQTKRRGLASSGQTEFLRSVINRAILIATEENYSISVRYPDDIRLIIENILKGIESDIYRSALFYCIALITFHPFENGNHRTSLHAAELLLLKNGYYPANPDIKNRKMVPDTNRLALQRWRLEYEEKTDLERTFFRIACNERLEERIHGIHQIMDGEYGKRIEDWLRINYRPNPNGP